MSEAKAEQQSTETLSFRCWCEGCRLTRGRRMKQKRSAFTLAEVLITLGIIGIVAAMTLPSLITNYREKQRVSQLKKTYSTLQQAFLRAEEAHGEYQYWDLAYTNTKEVDENGDYILDHSGNEKVLAYLGEFLNATKNDSDLKLTTYKLDGTLLNKDYIVSQSRYLKLNDGTILVMGWVSKDNTDVQVLFPGCERKGCRVGVDLFYFTLQPKVGFKPLGLPISDSNFLFENTCNLGKTVNTNGRGCTAWVIYKENMDYLHCNDLSWNGKSKCGK